MSENAIIALGAGIEGIFLLAVLFAFIMYYNNILKRDRLLITDLRKKIYKKSEFDRDKESKERRRHYRIKLNGEKCTVRVLDFGEQTLQGLNNKSIDVEMLDLSVSGMKIKCGIDFPIKEEVHVFLSFAKEDGTMIHVKGEVMRKETKHGRPTVNYGIQFVNPSAKEETEIQSYMNQKELSKKLLNSAINH